MNDEEYASNFQITKNDEYTFYKSIEDLRIKKRRFGRKRRNQRRNYRSWRKKHRYRRKRRGKPVETDTELKNKEVEESG